jgi:hypothetical protein
LFGPLVVDTNQEPLPVWGCIGLELEHSFEIEHLL